MQDLIIYNQKEVIIQVNGKTYQDTNENFLADYGKVVKYEAIDYNRDTKCCWLNGDADFDYDAMRKISSCSITIVVELEGKVTKNLEFPVRIHHDPLPFMVCDLSNEKDRKSTRLNSSHS